jgi:hypothetical protein
MKDRLPPDEIMRAMSSLAFESATTMLAARAREMAAEPVMEQINGRDALLAFAEAILSTNAKQYGKKGAAA